MKWPNKYQTKLSLIRELKECLYGKIIISSFDIYEVKFILISISTEA